LRLPGSSDLVDEVRRLDLLLDFLLGGAFRYAKLPGASAREDPALARPQTQSLDRRERGRLTIEARPGRAPISAEKTLDAIRDKYAAHLS